MRPVYVYYPEIKIKKADNVEEVVKVCPKKVFKDDKGKLKIVNLEACDLCNACTEIADIEVKGKEDEFILTVESWGQLDPKRMVQEGIEEFKKKLAEMKKLLK